MKRVMGLVLAVLMLCGVFAVGVSAMTQGECLAKRNELETQYNKWWNDIFYYPQYSVDYEKVLRPGKSLEAYKEEERLRSDSWKELLYKAGFNSGLTGNYESEWRVWQDYKRDEYALLNEYFDVGPLSAEVMELLDGSLICQNKPGGNPVPNPVPGPDADPDKIYDLFAGFLPASFAKVLTWIVKYVFFGWLWGRWL